MVHIFLIFALKHRLHCGYSLEPPQQEQENYEKNHIGISLFTAFKMFSIMHGSVCVIPSGTSLFEPLAIETIQCAMVEMARGES